MRYAGIFRNSIPEYAATIAKKVKKSTNWSR